MKALLSTIGSRGDVQPLVALAIELKALGHDVRLCVPPDFREWIESFGLPVTPIGPEVRKTATGPRPVAPPPSSEARDPMADFVAGQFETISEAAKACDVIVGATALQIGARSVAEKMGIPYVFVAYCPIVLPSSLHAPPALPPIPGQEPLPPTATNNERWARDGARFSNLFGPALNARREAMGLAPVSDVRAHVFGDRPWLAADATLAPWPEPDDGSVLQTGAWLLSDQRPLSPDLQAFLDAGDPPIYFGFGSMRAPQDLGQVVAGAARALGRRAIVSRGWADVAVANDTLDCFAVDDVNYQLLFRRVAAVVHHGGAGTTTAAAMAGAPQVVIPQIYDQHYFAQRIDALGIGVAHAPVAPTSDSLVAALSLALATDVAARAQTIAATMRRDGARAAALALQNLAL